MANFTTLQNTPIEIDLLALVNDNGWSFNANVAIHESCNAGTITLDSGFTANLSYDISIVIESISAGLLRVGLGNATPIDYTTAGDKSLTLISTTANTKLFLFSNANCRVRVLTVKQQATAADLSPNKTDTIVYTESKVENIKSKWTSYLNCYPDTGFSLFTNLYTFKDGSMHSHTDRVNRNRIYGTTYNSRVKLPFSTDQAKTYTNLEIRSNELLITTVDGVETSLGHISDLLAEDFLRFSMADGISVVDVYDNEGIYAAKFLRDKANYLEGERLKGSYITVELTTTDEKNFKLYRVIVKSQYSLDS
jgi:hypothetical protein